MFGKDIISLPKAYRFVGAGFALETPGIIDETIEGLGRALVMLIFKYASSWSGSSATSVMIALSRRSPGRCWRIASETCLPPKFGGGAHPRAKVVEPGRGKFAVIAAKLRNLQSSFLIPNGGNDRIPVLFSLQAAT